MTIPLANSKSHITVLSYAELMCIDSSNANPSNFICISFNPMEKSFGKEEQVIWSASGAWMNYCVECFSIPTVQNISTTIRGSHEHSSSTYRSCK